MFIISMNVFSFFKNRRFHLRSYFHNSSGQFVAFNAANRAKKFYFKNKQSNECEKTQERRIAPLRSRQDYIFSKIFLKQLMRNADVLCLRLSSLLAEGEASDSEKCQNIQIYFQIT